MTTTEPEIVEMPLIAVQWAESEGGCRLKSVMSSTGPGWRQMTLVGLDGDEITVNLPTRFLRDWVSTRYGDRLRALWQAENPMIRRVDICVGGAAPQPAALAESVSSPREIVRESLPAARVEAPRPNAAAAVTPSWPEERVEARSDLAAPLDPRFTFEGFIVGKPNEFAYACARRVAERPSSPGFNPLFLYGGVGLGKTHLMHAIAWELTDRTNAPVSVAYMSAEKFMYRFIAAIRSQSTMEFKENLRSVDVLMIDDLQFLIGKDNTQEEFFHTFNYLVEQGKQIVVSADKSPSDLNGLEHRLRTRLGCGMVADLHSTTYELRISILEAKAARAGVYVPVKVLEFLAHKITSNVRELEGALNRLVAHSQPIRTACYIRDDPRSSSRYLESPRSPGDDRGNSEKSGGTLQHQADRHVVGASGPCGGSASAGCNVPGETTDQPEPAGDWSQVW